MWIIPVKVPGYSQMMLLQTELRTELLLLNKAIHGVCLRLTNGLLQQSGWDCIDLTCTWTVWVHEFELPKLIDLTCHEQFEYMRRSTCRHYFWPQFLTVNIIVVNQSYGWRGVCGLQQVRVVSHTAKTLACFSCSGGFCLGSEVVLVEALMPIGSWCRNYGMYVSDVWNEWLVELW